MYTDYKKDFHWWSYNGYIGTIFSSFDDVHVWGEEWRQVVTL